jgi:hypothetical protein
MKNPILNRTIGTLPYIFALMMCGCSTFQPISSKPPVSSLILSSPVTERLALSTHILPAGEYKPAYEDSGGYYYQAPSKIISKDFIAYLEDGGIYIRRGSTNPTAFYILANYGQKVVYNLPDAKGIEVKP